VDFVGCYEMVINSPQNEQHEAHPCLYCRRCLQEVRVVRVKGYSIRCYKSVGKATKDELYHCTQHLL